MEFLVLSLQIVLNEDIAEYIKITYTKFDDSDLDDFFFWTEDFATEIELIIHQPLYSSKMNKS